MASQHIPTTTGTKARYVARLDTPRGVARELAKLYTSARRGELDTGDAYRLALILGQLSRSLEVTELADQLEALETASATTLRVA